MSQFQTPITIADALERIRRGDLAMPAIQRDYEWGPDRIVWLFDSLMRDYPVSSFLFWEVRGANVQNYKFYSFLKDYRETFRIRGPERLVTQDDRFNAVLDGQQRLTSLYIGFYGSYSWRVSHGRWNEDTETSRPTRKLYLNLSRRLDPEEDEQGREYEFEFKTSEESSFEDLYTDGQGCKWFRVGKTPELLESRKKRAFERQNTLSDEELDIYENLIEMLGQKRSINYYLEEDPDLQKALHIFIRINRGGAQLSISTILFSIAISVWKHRDAKQCFDQLRATVADLGYGIDNEFVLKAFLYVQSSDIKFKVSNFAHGTAELLEQNWSRLERSIVAAFRTVGRFGYNEQRLPTKNVLMPIIYYIYHLDAGQDFDTRVKYGGEREKIRKWLHNAILHRIMSDSSDGILSRIRRAFTDDVTTPLSKSGEEFPAEAIRQNVSPRMAMSEEFLDEIVHLQKDDKRTFPALALLFPHLDYRNAFHKDHMHPECGFQNLEINLDEIAEEDRVYFKEPYWWNSIVNLQMLDGVDNESKNGRTLSSWLDHEVNDNHRNRDDMLQRCIISQETSLAFKDFPTFARKREMKLKEILRNILV